MYALINIEENQLVKIVLQPLGSEVTSLPTYQNVPGLIPGSAVEFSLPLRTNPLHVRAGNLRV